MSAARTLVLLCLAATGLAAETPAWIDAYREPAQRLIGEATGSTFAWQRLARLTDTTGPRLSGSAGLARAIEWSLAEMRHDGLIGVGEVVTRCSNGLGSDSLRQPDQHGVREGNSNEI